MLRFNREELIELEEVKRLHIRLQMLIEPYFSQDPGIQCCFPVGKVKLHPFNEKLGRFAGWQRNYAARIQANPFQKTKCRKLAQFNIVIYDDKRNLMVLAA